MGKTLVIAEKPSVGTDLTRALGGTFAKHDGYLESDDYVVTWAVGRTVAETEQYFVSESSIACATACSETFCPYTIW